MTPQDRIVEIENAVVKFCGHGSAENWQRVRQAIRRNIIEVAEEAKQEAKTGGSREELAAFGSKMLSELMQGEWEPDSEWQQEMLEHAERAGLIRQREVEEGDDVPEEYDFIWERVLQPETRWIPCIERMPTEKDADANLAVWVLWASGSVTLSHWKDVDHPNKTHWQPTGLRQPEPPND